MNTVLSNVKVLDCSAWRNRRAVEVTAIEIIKGTLRSTSATSFTLQPTYKDHDFMQKSGFTAYCYETTIRVVEMVDGEVKLYSDISSDGKAFGYITTLEMTESQFNDWSQSNQFIHFIKNGEKIEYIDTDDFDWLDAFLG